jgi:Lhr-like helicase
VTMMKTVKIWTMVHTVPEAEYALHTHHVQQYFDLQAHTTPFPSRHDFVVPWVREMSTRSPVAYVPIGRRVREGRRRWVEAVASERTQREFWACALSMASLPTKPLFHTHLLLPSFHHAASSRSICHMQL